MPDYLQYQQSVAAEFKAYENRVRNIIDNHHYGEEGRIKEIILMNYLRRVLPKGLSLGTGFVKSKDSLTKQIDIIIYDNIFPTLFSEGDFVITVPQNVVGIIEVKSSVKNTTDLKQYIETANNNAKIICGASENSIFNGLFAYNCDLQLSTIAEALSEIDYQEITRRQHPNQVCSNRLFSCINHITLSSDKFIKLWPTGQDEANLFSPYYSLYDMPSDLSTAYFISNLQEFILKHTATNFMVKLPDELNAFFYPIPDGKEALLYRRIALRTSTTEV